MFTNQTYADSSSDYEEYHQLPEGYYSTRDLSHLDRMIFKKPKFGAKEVAIFIATVSVALILSALSIGYFGNDPENIPPLVFGILLVMFFILTPFYIAHKKIKSIEIKNDGLIINKTSKKSYFIGFNEFEQLVSLRHHNRRTGTYTGTSYQIIYYSKGKRTKLNLFDMNALQGSELTHEIYKAYVAFKNCGIDNYIVDSSLINREFTWSTDSQSKSLSKSRKISTLYYIISGFMTISPPLLVIIAMGIHYGLSPATIAVALGVILLIGSLVIMGILSKKRQEFYSARSLNRLFISNDALTVDTVSFRKHDIESILISRPDTGDPKCVENSVILIVTRNRLYKYETYVNKPGTRNSLKLLIASPAWSYRDFYQSVYNWAKANGVKVMDYVV